MQSPSVISYPSFSYMYKKKEVKANGRAINLKADRSLFGGIIMMAQKHHLNKTNILSHPVGPLVAKEGKQSNFSNLLAEKCDSSRRITKSFCICYR